MLRRADLWAVAALVLAPLLWFARQALGPWTLLPADNLFVFAPWQSFARDLGVGVAQNPLISDLVLENYPWKSFIVDALRAGRPADILWSPRLFGGTPFLAAGQHSALYPLSAIFYALPLWRAYGVFTWLQLGLAALGMYVFVRSLGLRRTSAFLSAVAYTFSGFFIVSVNFTMMIAAASWLPWLLAMIEIMARKQEEKGASSFSPVPYVAAGALCLGLQILAGHIEITYYVFMVAAFYAAWRLARVWYRTRTLPVQLSATEVAPARAAGIRPVARLAAWLIVLAVLGLALGAVQLVPLYELGSQSFRQGASSLQQVREWAWPSRQLITFLLPDAFGNPTHHAYFDIWAGRWAPVTRNALGETLNTIDWGAKNYVEGANYLGLLTLLLSAVAVLSALWRLLGRRITGSIHHIAAFAVLALVSLLFAFGTPLYAVLFYLVPGYSQLHSAFRWVFPYTLSMAVLAGFGLEMLTASPAAATPRRIGRALGGLAVVLGVGALLLVALSRFSPGPFVAAGERLMASSDLARTRGFADGAMAWSYEAAGLARFGCLAALSGALLLWGTRARGAGTKARVGADLRVHDSVNRVYFPAGLGPRLPVLALAAIGLLGADLWLFGHSFNPATDPKLLDFKPPVIAWLQAHQDPTQPWRLTSYEAPGEKLLNPNSAMPYGLEDIRGYDSIIPKQYVAFMERIQPQSDLLYNRIAPLYTQVGDQPNSSVLDSRLLDLLGTRYVVTTQAITNPGYRKVYDGEVQVYENLDALPRAFIAPRAVAAPDPKAALDLLQSEDPAETVVIEGLPAAAVPPPGSPELREARISSRDNRELFVDVNLSDRGWLVLTDSYFDGWKAYLRPFGVTGEGVDATGASIEQQLPIYRADGAFRAVYLPKAGQWTVRFVYSPRSVLLGVYVSFLGLVTLLLLAGWWTWGRYYRGEGTEVGTVAKNSAVQMSMSLLSRAIDFAFAMLRLRVLSPTGEGSYAFAISFYAIFEIIIRYGLGTLVMRDVAVDRTRARRYLTNAVALRVGLWMASLPVMALVCLFYWAVLHRLDAATAQAIALFSAALLFSSISDAINSIFNAFEKMEYPAGIATGVAIAKVALGALVLLPPLEWGFVGLAMVSLVMNIVQAIWLWVILRRKVLPADHEGARAGEELNGGEARRRFTLTPVRPAGFDLGLQRYMLRESGPLMLNNLLATVFWRISQWVLYGARNPAALGIFSAGVKYLDGLNIIPAYFTLAIFPLMSRYAAAGKDAFLKSYRLSAQLLFIVALPIAVFFTFASTLMIRLLGGAAYLPGGATALSIMIWSIPIGFINSVTQYTLIAVNQQRFLTRAFLLGVAFTAAANLIFVPRFGYLAAAIIQIPAELVLFLAFDWAVRRHVAPISWPSLMGRPALAVLVNAGLTWWLIRAGLPLLIAIGAGFAAYVAALTALGTFHGDDFAILRRLLSEKLRGRTDPAPIHTV